MSAILYKKNSYGGTSTATDAGHVLVNETGGDTVTAQAKFNTITVQLERILGNFATVEETSTASKAYKVGEYLVYNSFLYRVTTAIAAGGTIDNTVNGNVTKTTVDAEMANKIIDCVNITISAGTGDIATINDARITADHKVAGYHIVWGNPSYITSDVTVTTSEGQAKINGTATAATTATFQLVKPN